MRKLSELLPIARSLLISADDVLPNGQGRYGLEVYTCHAAQTAAHKGLMTHQEYHELKASIEAEIHKQRYGAAAIGSIAEKHGVTRITRHPEYIAFRDKWLDTFQAKLEGVGL